MVSTMQIRRKQFHELRSAVARLMRRREAPPQTLGEDALAARDDASASVRRLPIALAGVVLGSTLGIAAVAVAEDGEPTDPEEIEAIASATPGPIPDLEEVGPTIVEAQDDVGPEAAVAGVKAAVVALIEANTAVMAMPTDLTERLQSVTTLEPQRILDLARIWTPTELFRQTTEILESILAVAKDSSYWAFTESRFVVGEWQGVSVSGNTAHAVLTGHQEFKAPGEDWHSNPESQYQIDLSKNLLGLLGWQLTKMDRLVLDGEM